MDKGLIVEVYIKISIFDNLFIDNRTDNRKNSISCCNVDYNLPKINFIITFSFNYPPALFTFLLNLFYLFFLDILEQNVEWSSPK